MFSILNHIKPELVEAVFTPKSDYDGLINLASNECYHPMLPELYKEFFSLFVNKSGNRYPYYDAYREAISSNMGIASDNIAFSPGSDLAISLLLSQFTAVNKSLILHSPNYYNYQYYCEIYGLECLAVNFLQKTPDDFVREMLRTMQHKKQSTIILTNPDTYIGRLLSTEEIRTLLESANQHGHLVVIDEAHSVFSGQLHHDLLKDYDNLFILKSLSKCYAAAGVRATLVLGHPKLIENFKKLGVENSLNHTSLGFFQFIISKNKEFSEIHSDIVNWRESYIAKAKKKYSDWLVYPSKALFITIDVKNDSLAKAITKKLQKNGILIRHLEKFSPQLSSMLRITVREQNIFNQVFNLMS